MSLNVGGGTGGHACAGGGGGRRPQDGGSVADRGSGATVAGVELGVGASACLPARSSRIGYRLAQLHVRLPDIPLELLLIGLAQNGLLVGLRELAEEKHIRWRAPDGVESSSLPPLTFCESSF